MGGTAAVPRGIARLPVVNSGLVAVSCLPAHRLLTVAGDLRDSGTYGLLSKE